MFSVRLLFHEPSSVPISHKFLDEVRQAISACSIPMQTTADLSLMKYEGGWFSIRLQSKYAQSLHGMVSIVETLLKPASVLVEEDDWHYVPE